MLADVDRIDNGFFNVHVKQTEKTDTIIRLLLEVTHEALLDCCGFGTCVARHGRVHRPLLLGLPLPRDAARRSPATN